MASEIRIGDLTTSVPGVRSDLTFAPGQSLPATANLAVLVEDSRFQEDAIYLFNSAAEFSSFDPASTEDPIWADLLWADGLAAVDSLRIINIKPNTQATLDYPDANTDAAVVLESNVWGPEGNKTFVQTTLNGTNKIDFIVERSGVVEKATVTREDLGTLEYTGGINDVVTLAWDDSGVVVASQRDVGPKLVGPGTPLTVDSDWDQFLTDGVLTVTLDPGAGVAHTDDVTVTINGTSAAGAVIQTVLTFISGDASEDTGVTEFHSITSVVVDSADNAWVGIATVSGSKTFNVTNLPAKNIIADIGRVTGFQSASVTARNRLAIDADYFPATNIHLGTAKSITAMAVPMVEALAKFKLISATRGANGLAPSGTLSAFLTGGSESVTPASAMADALEILETVDVNVVLPWDTSDAVAQLMEDHCLAGAVQGYERRAWVATDLNKSITDSLALTSTLNSHLVSVCDFGHKAAGVTYAPLYTALRLIGMIGKLDAGASLTNKNTGLVEGVRAYTRKEEHDAIQAGLVTFTVAPDGSIRVVREVTTYLSDNDSNRVEGSAVRAVQFFVRDLREQLQEYVGKKNTAGMRKFLTQFSQARAQLHIDDFETLVAYRGFDLVALSEGDGYDFVGEVSPVKPLNFLTLRFAVRNF